MSLVRRFRRLPFTAYLFAALRRLFRGAGLRRRREGADEVMHNTIDAIHELLDHVSGPLLCIETGTIRSYDEKHESTRHIADALGNRGRLISVDINPESIKISKDICKGRTNIEWVLASSTDYLKGLHDERFHFALLDSANDKNLIFKEFNLLIPHMAEGSILIVDDAGISPSGRRKDRLELGEKGHRVWEFLVQHDISFSVLMTSVDHGTQLRIDLTAMTKNRIEKALRASVTL